MKKAWPLLIFMLWGGELHARACPYIAIQVGKTTIDEIRHHCGEPASSATLVDRKRYVYDNFGVTTELRGDVVTELRIHDPGYVDENGVQPGMSEVEFRERFPQFEYTRTTARDPVSDNLYQFRNRRVTIITVR